MGFKIHTVLLLFRLWVKYLIFSTDIAQHRKWETNQKIIIVVLNSYGADIYWRRHPTVGWI